MTHASRTLSLLAFVAIACAGDVVAQPAGPVDLLIKGGQVVDGTGGPRMQADVAITGDHIVYVGRAPVKAKRVIDATGKVVSFRFRAILAWLPSFFRRVGFPQTDV